MYNKQSVDNALNYRTRTGSYLGSSNTHLTIKLGANPSYYTTMSILLNLTTNSRNGVYLINYNYGSSFYANIVTLFSSFESLDISVESVDSETMEIVLKVNTTGSVRPSAYVLNYNTIPTLTISE